MYLSTDVEYCHGVITITERDELQALSIAMQAYEMKLELLSSATVLERAVHFVNKHRGSDPTKQGSSNK